MPTPEVAFYKIFGLTALFPRSHKFGKYHLSYLSKDEVHEVEILSGAFMLMRKTVLDITGLLDESFFMYGEDIDLSYRIVKAGYKNYYFPLTTIIHYKGESTKKSSINYVIVFYKAMVIFANKHFSSQNARLFSRIINFAVWFRAGLSIVKRFVMQLIPPVGDATLLFLIFYFAKPFWETFRFGGEYYPELYMQRVVPIYVAVWTAAIYFAGGYRRPLKISRLLRGIFAGTVLLLVAYALTSEIYRFSRVLLLTGGIVGFGLLPVWRAMLHKTGSRHFRISRRKQKRIAIVGAVEGADNVVNVLRETLLDFDVVGIVANSNAPKRNTEHNVPIIGSMSQLPEIVRINNIDELIFCASDLSSHEIIENMLALSGIDLDFKIAPPESESIIGSNSINTAGELYTLNINSVATRNNSLKKRSFDVAMALLLLLFSPLLVWRYRQKIGFIRNILAVLWGAKCWVGYHHSPKADKTQQHLPPLPPSVLSVADNLKHSQPKSASQQQVAKLNINYAKDYRVETDLRTLLGNISKLDR